LLSEHPKANELSNSMLSFKDLFLVGFFLSIGLSGIPTFESVGIALLLCLVLPFKAFLYFITLTRFKLRSRTATLSSLSLANYSEFGLIVGAAALSHTWIDPEWMVIFALALTFSFIIASPINLAANHLFIKWHSFLVKFEREERLPDDRPVDVGESEIIILGMGRVGTGTYDILEKKYGKNVLGIEYNKAEVLKHKAANRNVILGDITDSDFWSRIHPSSNARLVILATSKHSSHLHVLDELKSFGSKMKIAALWRHKEEEQELKDNGVEIIFNLYTEAGMGYAEHILQEYSNQSI
jgi:hypothetical protein